MERNLDPKSAMLDVEILDELINLAILGMGYSVERGSDLEEDEVDFERLLAHIRKFNPSLRTKYQSKAGQERDEAKKFKDFLKENLNKTVCYDSTILYYTGRHTGRLVGMKSPGMYKVVQEPHKIKVTVDYSQMKPFFRVPIKYNPTPL